MSGNNGEAIKPLVVTPAYAVVVNHLRRAIHLGTYGPGDKLPPERILAPQLGVSRVTLREAIRVLEAENYVSTRRGATGGVTVRERTESPEELRAHVRARREEIGALLEFRLANERLAAERAARLVLDEDLEALEETVAAMREESGVGPFRQADSAFHIRIARVAACELLQEAVEEARARMFLPLDALDYEVMLASTVRGHEHILKGLRKRDPAAAGRAMATHIAATTKELDAILGSD
jgi:GntR family transcriptional regulator, transcriptional repressor for pyruvate dehydrogenase complex